MCQSDYRGGRLQSQRGLARGQWEGRKDAEGELVCHARFRLSKDETAALAAAAANEPEAAAEGEEPVAPAAIDLPSVAFIDLHKYYGYATDFDVEGFPTGVLDITRATAWAQANVPKFVYIHDYDMSGAQVELTQLRDRWDQVGRKNRHQLSNEDQTILIILDLANIELDDFLKKGESGRRPHHPLFRQALRLSVPHEAIW